jgi:hypothetical protein
MKWRTVAVAPLSFFFSVYREEVGQGVKLTSHLRVVPRSGMHGAVSLLPYMLSWHGASVPSGETLPLSLMRSLVDGKMCYLKPITRYKNQSSLLEGLLLGVRTLRFPPIPTVPFDSAADAAPFFGFRTVRLLGG